MKLPEVKPAWPDQNRLRNDSIYQPIIADGKLIVASSMDDSVTAYDLRDGGELWRFCTGGPIRVAPAATEGKIFVGSDDGWMYALEARTGAVAWKMKGAPRTRPVIGNERLIDTWPIRGGPVVEKGRLYFAAGIWPFMGIFLHCVDAKTRSEEHTSELQSQSNIVCRLLLEKKKKTQDARIYRISMLSLAGLASVPYLALSPPLLLPDPHLPVFYVAHLPLCQFVPTSYVIIN